MKFLSIIGLGAVAVNALHQRPVQEHDFYKPNTKSDQCCQSEGHILCGKKVKDCCDAKKCEKKTVFWVETEWCPDGTQVGDEQLNCHSCSDECKKRGFAVCSTGLGKDANKSQSTIQCCSAENCQGDITGHHCAEGTAVDLGKCIQDSTWDKLFSKFG